MIATMPVPQLDPMPVPGPVWLMRTLLLLTFFLHLLFMNTLLGGTIVAFVCSLRQKKSQFAAQLGSDLGRVLPVVFAFTITLGVAPLLFLQVLYGNLLYTSSILIGIPWLSIIGLVLLAYYGVYYFSLRGEKHGAGATAVLGVAALLLAGVAHIFTNNMTLMLTPQRWLNIYTSNPGGLNMNWADPTVLPRYLHFFLSALAVTGLYVVITGLRKRQTPYGRWLIERGARLFAITTILNFAVGFWFLVTLPFDVRMTFMGRNGLATALLGLGMLLPLGAVAHLLLAPSKESPVRTATIGIGAGVLTVAVMVVIRDLLRNAYLAPVYNLAQLHVKSQWGVIALFVVLFIAGLATLFYMLRAVAKASKTDARATAVQGK
jgi:hypothetical protein